MSKAFNESLPWMLTATVTMEPAEPVRLGGLAGHDEGLTDWSAMQTSPVAALALGTKPGSTKTIDKTIKNSGKIVLDFFKNIHYSSIRMGR
jgi:hypothetical protein